MPAVKEGVQIGLSTQKGSFAKPLIVVFILLSFQGFSATVDSGAGLLLTPGAVLVLWDAEQHARPPLTTCPQEPPPTHTLCDNQTCPQTKGHNRSPLTGDHP